jgi:Flp pilus assembly protein TadD/O-antigen ligase
MKSLPLALAGALIVYFSWQAGGTAEETRLLSIIAAGAIFIAAAVLAALGSKAGRRRDSSFLIPLALLLAAAGGVLASPAPAVARVGGWEIAAAALLLSAFIILPPPSRSLTVLVAGLSIWTVALVAYGLLNGTNPLLRSTFVNRNHFCAFLGIVFPFALAPALGPGRKGVRAFWGLLASILAGGMVLTRSRGGMAALFCTLFFFWGMERKRRGGSLFPVFLTGSIATVLLALILAFSAGFYPLPSILYPLSPTLYPLSPTLHPLPSTEISVSTRISLMGSTVSLFLARPFFGWGWGSFPFVYPRYKAPGVWYTVSHSHNEWLEIAAEGGIVGLALIAFALIFLWRRVVRSANAGDAGGDLFARGAAGSLVYAAIHSNVEFIFRVPAISLLLAAVGGVALSIGGGAREDTTQPIEGTGRGWRVGDGGWGRRAGLLAAAAGAAFFLIMPAARSLLSGRASERGFRLLEQGKIEQSASYFSRAQALDQRGYLPPYGLARVEIARFSRARERTEAYARIGRFLDRARENNPWDTRTGWTLAAFLSRLSDNAGAEKALREAVSLDPSNPFFALGLARLRLLREDPRGAAALLRKASATYICVWPSALSFLASRVNDYSVLQELPPDGDDFRRDLAYTLLAAHRPEEARQEAIRAAEIAPGDSSNWLALGRIAAASGRLDEARDAYRTMLTLSPSDPVAWSELGDLHLRRGEEEDALRCFLMAVGLSPKALGPARSAGRLLALRRGAEAAVSFWETISRRNPESGYPRFALAEFLADQGEEARAREELSRALELEPANPGFLLLQKKLGSPPDPTRMRRGER